MSVDTEKSILIDHLQLAHADYTEACNINSKMKMHLFLGNKDMFFGLCSHLKKYVNINSLSVFTKLIYELAEDYEGCVENPNPMKFWFEMPVNIDDLEEIKQKALKPRIELLEKTIKRLQHESKISA